MNNIRIKFIKTFLKKFVINMMEQKTSSMKKEEICSQEKLSAEKAICFSVYVFLLAFLALT